MFLLLLLLVVDAVVHNGILYLSLCLLNGHMKNSFSMSGQNELHRVTSIRQTLQFNNGFQEIKTFSEE